MKHLVGLKRKQGLSILVIAHTPKRLLISPLSQNDLAGSKKLFNFVDSCFAIGNTARGKDLRYVKQLKVRYGDLKYGTANVQIYCIEKKHGFTHFEFVECDDERNHLQIEGTQRSTGQQFEERKKRVWELYNQGMSQRQISQEMGLSKTAVQNYIIHIKGGRSI